MTNDRSHIERLAAGTLMIGFPGTDIPQGLIDRGVRNFILFARNVGSAEEVRALTDEIRARAGQDALIAIDHEGGRVNRLAATGAASQFPAAMAWAATDDLALARRASEAAAGELAALGINVNFAPVVEPLADHRNPALGTRCFSDNTEVSAQFGAAYAAGHRQAAVASTAKHFAGHSDTPIDSHVDLPEISKSVDRIQSEDIPPFRAATQEGADIIMVGHAWYSAIEQEKIPATVSTALGAMARDVIGPEGLVVTDCLEMGAVQNRMSTGEAAVRALKAGIDMVLISHQLPLQEEALDAIVQAVESGELPRERLVEANRRIDAVRGRVRLRDAAPENAPESARELARKAVTLVRDDAQTLPISGEEPLAVVAFASVAASVVEGPRVLRRPHLADAVNARHPNVRSVTVEPGMTPEQVVEAVGDIETVLVGTAFTTGRPEQAAVVRALHAAGKRVVVMALADPFDLLSFPSVPTYLVTYDDTPLMLDAALDVVLGEGPAQGHLPVELRGLYPRGHHA